MLTLKTIVLSEQIGTASVGQLELSSRQPLDSCEALQDARLFRLPIQGNRKPPMPKMRSFYEASLVWQDGLSGLSLPRMLSSGRTTHRHWRNSPSG